MTHTHSNSRAGFTLVELLVVISIIMILLAILLPVLGYVKRAGRQAVCLSNLRQCAQATGQYTIDHHRYFPYSSTVSTPRPYTKCYFWGTDTAPVYTHPAPLMNYLDSADCLQCPSLPWGSYVPQGAQVTEPTSAFAYNALSLDPSLRGLDTRRPDTIIDPAALIVFADAAILDRWTAGGVLKNSAYLEPPESQFTPVATNHFRHGDQKTNLNFADGHAETMDPAGEPDEYDLGFVGEKNDPHYIQE